jgi:hypothetical protein
MMPLETPTKPKYKLTDLLAEMPNGLPSAPGWEVMPAVGLETESMHADGLAWVQIPSIGGFD